MLTWDRSRGICSIRHGMIKGSFEHAAGLYWRIEGLFVNAGHPTDFDSPWTNRMASQLELEELTGEGLFVFPKSKIVPHHGQIQRENRIAGIASNATIGWKTVHADVCIVTKTSLQSASV